MILLSSVKYTSTSLERGDPRAWPLDFVGEAREAGRSAAVVGQAVRQTQISELFVNLWPYIHGCVPIAVAQS